MQAQCYLTAQRARDRRGTQAIWCRCPSPETSHRERCGVAPSNDCVMKHTRAWLALVLASGLCLVGMASAQSADAGSARPLLASPVTPLRAGRLFDPPPQPWNAGHRGIDLYASPAGEVYSPGSGVVVFASYVVNRPVLSIELDVGLRSSMEPVANLVEVGQRVRKGDLVGTVDDAPDAGHCEPDWCVHWGLRRGDDYVNPLDWLTGYGPIRLLPLRG